MTSIQPTTQPTVQRTQEPASESTQAFFTPRTDIYETPEALVLVADVPGAHEGGISLTFEGDVLTIEARIEQQDPEGMTLVHREYDLANYRRTFTVHTPIDRDGITASLAEGVLRVTLPKAKEARVQRIQVRAAK